MDITHKLFTILFYLSLFVGTVSAVFMAYIWFSPPNSSNPYSFIFTGMLELYAFIALLVSAGFSYFFYCLIK